MPTNLLVNTISAWHPMYAADTDNHLCMKILVKHASHSWRTIELSSVLDYTLSYDMIITLVRRYNEDDKKYLVDIIQFSKLSEYDSHKLYVNALVNRSNRYK